MDVTSITVHIRYSKSLADGSYKTVELGAERTLNPDEDYHEAQVALYHELGETMKYVFSGNGAGKSQNSPEKPAPPQPETQQSKHYCRQHRIPFKKYSKEGREWWSHKLGSGWCRES